MNNDNVPKFLKSKGIGLGDRIKVEQHEKTLEGLLMPRGKDDGIIVVKLDSGYNIGVNSKGAKITLVEKSKIKKQDVSPGGKGDISILGCGGTISSKVEYKTGAVYPMLNPKEITISFPQIEKISSIKTKNLLSILSEDMNPEHWKIIAKEVAKEIKSGAKGVVLLHGTDTMHYTSSALSFMLQNLPVPVVIVGAQRSSDRPSSDNRLNLVNSVYTATKDIAEVGICMHANTSDDFCHFHRGTRARKMHTSRRDAFRSVDYSPLALVDYSKNLFKPLYDYNKREKRTLNLDTKINENVALIYFYPGIKPKFIDKLSSYDGIVIMGTGLGHVSTNPFGNKDAEPIIKNLKSLIDSGIPVVMAPQTIYGRLDMNVYTAGRMLNEIGVIGDGADWTPETAFIKLSYVLAHTKNMKKVQEMMMKNLVGELSDRSSIKESYPK